MYWKKDNCEAGVYFAEIHNFFAFQLLANNGNPFSLLRFFASLARFARHASLERVFIPLWTVWTV